MVSGRHTHPRVSFDVNPASRQTLEALAAEGWLGSLVAAGARLHQAGCNGCIGMGQAPATGKASLRTFPRNFPGRSGTKDDQVYLCSPETATAAALTGVITDPRDLGLNYPTYQAPALHYVNTEMIVAPSESGHRIELDKGPNIVSLPEFDPLPDRLSGPVLVKVGDDISTGEIMPAGARVLPYRSNIPAMAAFAFDVIDSTYAERALDTGDHLVVAGWNYGQGSSREHAAIVPRYLGLRAVLARSFARIHRQNLLNFAVLALTFVDADDYDRIQPGDILTITDTTAELHHGDTMAITNETRHETYRVRHGLTDRQVDIVLQGSLLDAFRHRQPTRS
jgi:aconitate hydratase